MRPVPITTLKGGINRLKVKGAARADMLYDLVNGYITNAATVSPREGNIRNATLDATTAGLMSMAGKLNVFSATLENVPAGYVDNVLVDQGAPTISFVPPPPVINPVYTVPSLLHFEDGNLSTTFTDSGSNPQTWTANGGIAESTDQAIAGTGSLKFVAGSGANYISAPIFNTALDIFTGQPDFTVEFWLYLPSPLPAGGTYRWLGYDYNGSGGVTGFDIWSDGSQVTVEPGPGSPFATINITTSQLAPGWNHIALCRASNFLRLFVNGDCGNSTGNAHIAANFPAPNSASTLKVGSILNTGASAVTAYVDEVRVTKGRALYGGNFKLPGLTGSFLTLPFTTTVTFPYSVTSLLHFEDGGNSTAFVDAAGPTWAAHGAAVESTTQAKFGLGSGAFLNSGDYISSAFARGSSGDYNNDVDDCDFTIEMFVYPPQSTINDGNHHFLFDSTTTSNGGPNATGFTAYWVGTALVVTPHGTSVNTYSGVFPTGNTWYHVAFVRKGDAFTTFVNGISQGTVSGYYNLPSPSVGNTVSWYIGDSPQVAQGSGYVDEFRAIRGLACYVANFTPPTAAFPIPSNIPNSIVKIWFAKPFMGFPYVVAQFSNGDIRHFWLQSTGNWAPNTFYNTSSIVLPNIGNTGLAMQAVRIMPPNPTWAAETQTAAGAVVEPTEYTGFAYRAVAVAGTSPHTGPSEPAWPTTVGGSIQEFGDFGTTATSAATTQDSTTPAAQPLGTNITDRYGDADTILNANNATSGNASTTAAASTAVTTWAPGINYAPGAVVRPTTTQGAVINAIPNGDFEAGNDGNWVLSNADVTIQNAGGQYQGNYCVKFALNHDTQTCTMTNYGVVTPGQSVTATGYLNPNNNGTDTTMWLVLNWYNSSDVLISTTPTTTTTSNGYEGFGYRQVTITGTAPAGAAHVRVAIKSATGTNPNPSYGDLVAWNLAVPAATSNFLFEAVQGSAGVSGTTEPTWPTIAGNTVIDGGVTWKAIGTSIITWQAIPIMQSGASEPTWPSNVGLTVVDGSTFTSSDGHVTSTNMSWLAISRMISDPKCPNSAAVALGASHVFAADNDIAPFSAVVNPTDWTTANDAGYLPTGLNNYGDNPVAVLALYRSNLVVANSGGYQMWQIDPDPQNMALLDAEPVGSTWPLAAQAVANDLLLLTEVGVRNLSVVGATANLAVGNTGQPVDPIVTAQMKLGTYYPRSLYYPGRGQYWLIFGPQAFVLTVNGMGQKTWSRYLFPDNITDSALLNGVLYLRTAGNLVWQFDANTLMDDALQTPVQAALASFATGGTLAAGTYYYVVTATNANGETIASNEQSAVTTGTTSSVTVTWAAIPGATGYNVYRGTATGAENVFYSVASPATSFLDTNAASTAGSPPTKSTAGVKFTGIMQWPYLDNGALGQHKQFEGLDIVGDGQVTIQIGWREDDPTTFNDNPGFATSLNVTPPYTINAADTQPGTPIPIGPMTSPSYTIILTFAGNQVWSWEASNCFVTDNTGGGAFG